MPSESPAPRLRHGTPEFRRASFALCAIGFATLGLLYCVQPLMPLFSAEFGVSPATSSLSLSLTTGVMAPMLLVAGAFSEIFGRKGFMLVALAATSALTILAALMPEFSGVLVLRALTGIAIAGVPAVAMAYLGEEVDPQSLGYATGLLVGGNGIGGLAGRLVGGALGDLGSWRLALVAIGVFGLLSALVVWRLLPESRHFEKRPMRLGALHSGYGAHLRDGAMLALFALAFLLMGSFVTLYNYLGYRLTEPPYLLGAAAASAVYLSYLFGVFSSAWMGRLADRFGRRHVLWAGVLVMAGGTLVTLALPLWSVAVGIVVATIGFFGAHSVASSWVTRRAPAAKGQAASIYLFMTYLGSSVVGTSGGVAWVWLGWPGVIILVGGLLALAMLLSARLARIPS